MRKFFCFDLMFQSQMGLRPLRLLRPFVVSSLKGRTYTCSGLDRQTRLGAVGWSETGAKSRSDLGLSDAEAVKLGSADVYLVDVRHVVAAQAQESAFMEDVTDRESELFYFQVGNSIALHSVPKDRKNVTGHYAVFFSDFLLFS